MTVIKMTPSTQSEEDIQQILDETGLNLTGMDPSVIKEVVDDFHSFTRRALGGNEKMEEVA